MASSGFMASAGNLVYKIERVARKQHAHHTNHTGLTKDEAKTQEHNDAQNECYGYEDTSKSA
jgi:hypothetical protein